MAPHTSPAAACAATTRQGETCGMDALKADETKKEISEDDRKRGETEVQKLTDDMIKEADAVAMQKEQEILGR